MSHRQTWQAFGAFSNICREYGYLFGDLIDDLVEHQDWDFSKEMEWTTNDQTTQALLKEAWTILADESRESSPKSTKTFRRNTSREMVALKGHSRHDSLV